MELQEYAKRLEQAGAVAEGDSCQTVTARHTAVRTALVIDKLFDDKLKNAKVIDIVNYMYSSSRWWSPGAATPRASNWMSTSGTGWRCSTASPSRPTRYQNGFFVASHR